MQRPIGARQPAAAGSAVQAATAAGSEDRAPAGGGDEAYAAVARALRDSDEDADTRLREARSAGFRDPSLCSVPCQRCPMLSRAGSGWRVLACHALRWLHSMHMRTHYVAKHWVPQRLLASSPALAPMYGRGMLYRAMPHECVHEIQCGFGI